MTPPEPKRPPPTEDKLRLMLSNGVNFVSMVEDMIEKHTLPFIVEIDQATGIGTLKNTLTPGELYLNQFITLSPKMLEMKELARKMAYCPYEVLITGDTGTGKELIGNSMIGNRTGPVKAVNCAGMPETLIESELFGHVRGAFTGADKDKKGLMSEAAGGVMFLDEVGELPMQVQAKLLRALQFKRVRPVGAVSELEITCKFVCATNRNLKDMVEKGTFRRDLYARISTLELDILPLKDRPEDVRPIIESLSGGVKFLEKYKDLIGSLDLSLNVRSLQQYVIRYNVLGKINL